MDACSLVVREMLGQNASETEADVSSATGVPRGVGSVGSKTLPQTTISGRLSIGLEIAVALSPLPCREAISGGGDEGEGQKET